MEGEEKWSLSLETGKEELSKKQGREGPSVVTWRLRKSGQWKGLKDNRVWG